MSNRIQDVNRERVVVTGMGQVTALGADEDGFAARLFGGRPGIRPLRRLDAGAYRTGTGAELDDDVLAAALKPAGARRHDRTVALALAVSGQALEQAGLTDGNGPQEPRETGTIFGSGYGPSHSTGAAYEAFHTRGPAGMRPTSVPRCMVNAISSQVSIAFRLTGPNYAVVASCASSTVAIGLAFRMIRDGYAERVLCGGVETMFDPVVYAAWDRLRVMTPNPDPRACFRPFDLARDGFVLGEGAGALVLERLGSARSRNARIRAELCGYGESSDAEHITRPSVAGQVRAMRAALDCAGMTPEHIDLVNAHGTATKASDEAESQSVRAVFGDALRRTTVVSSKPFFGHLIGASGVVEAIATILCLESGRVHANLNLDHPDPVCDLPFAGPAACDVAVSAAMSNSFGFGGSNGVLILRKFEGEP